MTKPEDSLLNLSFEQFRSRIRPLVDAGVGDDLFILDVKGVDSVEMLKYPIRIKGYLAVYCSKGDFSVEINLDKFRVTEHTLFVSVPSNILKISEIAGDPKEIHFIVVAASEDIISNLNLNFNRLVTEGMALLSNPCFMLEGRDLDLASRYLDLAIEIARQENLPNKSAAVSSLISSLFYLFEGIWRDRIVAINSGAASGQSSRARLVFSQFVQLVTEYHTTERKMAFYAGRLCLTPKYLSKLVRDVSGRSAPEWIDDFVVLEAKNMLKYSELTIKQIVYKLNFPNQSVFYKFFKSHTGMTPSEYRDS